MKVIALLLFALCKLSEATLQLYPGVSLLAPGAAAMQFIKHDDEEIIHHCFLAYETETNNYTLPILLNGKQDFSSAPVFGNRLSNLERNLCGVTIADVKISDPHSFKIFANYTDSEDKERFFNKSFAIDIYEHILIKDEMQYVEMGTYVRVTCGIQNVQISCTMFDPQGVMVKRAVKRCDYDVEYLTMEHIGNWTCFPNLAQIMAPLSEVMELRLAPNPNISTWYKEEDGYGLLGCQYNFYKLPITTACEFIDPQSTKYRVTPTSATERFTCAGIDYVKSRCQIEFKLPLLAEEIGRWSCLIDRRGDLTGAYVDVYPLNSRERRAIESLDYPRRSVKYVKLGSPFTVLCEVPYSVNHCYLKSPTGEIIYGGGFDYYNMGRCTTTLERANTSHLGMWTCHYSRENEADDDIIEVEVIEEYSLNALNKDVKVSVEQSGELMCRATTPIRSCQYVDPNGLTYNVSPDKKSEGIYYTGRSFEYGECGLKIDAVEEEHLGVWSCIINNKGEVEDSLRDTVRLYADMLEGTSPSTALDIGIPVGIMVVAVVLLGAALLGARYRKRSPDNPRMSNDSGNSNTDIPIFDMQAVVYDTNNS